MCSMRASVVAPHNGTPKTVPQLQTAALGHARKRTIPPERNCRQMSKPAWEVRMDAFEKRMYAMWEQSEKRWQDADKKHLARMERIDRRMDATSKLLQYGAKILIDIEESQRELVKSLRTIPRNGHDKKP